ncbi:Ubiquinone biosynthesis monooxygenase [Paramicrosporidium saccamoebae]|uniref:Ubiquinone biosynthesis monooxygenase n=1 Tax=Paramicrosporidium saccamoebae TaxID=1246581 RepID=A0A2H9TQP9_9FUNG|nr:Ubiquinone biosynthesis monooxygenase [Paramicrosporidium saccamoebae]
MKHYDIAIVGGGIVGRSHGKRTNRLRVALIDASPAPKTLPARTDDLASYSNRASSITKNNYEYLERLSGPHKDILAAHSKGFREMRVWEGDTPSSLINFDSPDMMGRIVENNATVYALQQCMEGVVDTYTGRVEVQREKDHVQLRLEEESLTCNLVVGADGKESVVRKLVNPNIFGRQYGQKGLVATIRTESPDKLAAFQRFLPTGPFALLPIGKDVLSMVWTLPSEKADFITSSKLPKEKLLLLLNAAFRLLNADVQYYLANPDKLTLADYQWREGCLEEDHQAMIRALPNLIDVSSDSLAAFPLTMSIARKTVAERSVIIGDAAHVIHPLAGQGVNLGIADVRSLAAAIDKAVAVGADVGRQEHYQSHGQQRLASSMAMAGFCDSIHRIFDPSFPSPLLRTMGMRLFQKSPLPVYDIAPVLSYSELFADNVQEKLKPRDWIRQVISQLEGRPIICPGAQPDHVPRGALSVGRWTAIKITRRNNMPLPHGFYSENHAPKCLRGVTIDVNLPHQLLRFPELDLISPWWLDEEEYMAWWDAEESLDWNYIVTTPCPILESTKMNVYTHTLIRPAPELIEPLKSRATVLSCKQAHATVGVRGEKPIKKQTSDAELLVKMYPDLYYIPKDPTPYMSKPAKTLRTVPVNPTLKASVNPTLKAPKTTITKEQNMATVTKTTGRPGMAASVELNSRSIKSGLSTNELPVLRDPSLNPLYPAKSGSDTLTIIDSKNVAPLTDPRAPYLATARPFTKTKITASKIPMSVPLHKPTGQPMARPGPRSCQISKVPLKSSIIRNELSVHDTMSPRITAPMITSTSIFPTTPKSILKKVGCISPKKKRVSFDDKAQADSLSSEQIAEYKEAFSLFDRDADGRIHTSELGTLMRALGRNPTEAEVRDHIKALDPHSTSHITFSDFLALMATVPPLDPAVAERELLEAFRVFDREGKGTIATAELRHIVTSLGEKLTEGEADEMMSEADPERCGTVDYAKFIKKMLTVVTFNWVKEWEQMSVKWSRTRLDIWAGYQSVVLPILEKTLSLLAIAVFASLAVVRAEEKAEGLNNFDADFDELADFDNAEFDDNNDAAENADQA